LLDCLEAARWIEDGLVVLVDDAGLTEFFLRKMLFEAVPTMPPGWREKARMFSALPRSSTETARRMLAVLDWP
jgi:hypothetical protein